MTIADRTTASRLALGIAVTAVVGALALLASQALPLPKRSFVASGFVTHTVMLLLSLAVIWVFQRAKFADFGFTTATYRFRASILLWVVPTAILSLLTLLAPAGREAPAPFARFSELQVVVFVWIYSSVCEEVLTRGLLQTLISPHPHTPSTPRVLTTPVVVSALFFAAMHLVLVPSMGPAAAVPIVLALFLGLVAGYYRQATGSLVPAILVHALFNIGGTLPRWIAGWVTQ